MVPLPEPLPPEVIVIQLTVLVAVQLQPPGVGFVITLNDPPVRVTVMTGGDQVTQSHVPPLAPDCDTVNVCPAIVIVPVRTVPLLLATE